MLANGLVYDKCGAEIHRISSYVLGKSLWFSIFLFFGQMQNPKDFADFINIHRPLDFALKSALYLSIVSTSFYILFFNSSIISNGIWYALNVSVFPVFLKLFITLISLDLVL
ncbi:hypothetical protein MTsPCn5_29150 [Croceitalea sp. MTPC5]|nr:hypothetical protein MTsPCn5_29150 [Croceitalea sp. MTPC5]